jgi:hypothetical protein
MLPDGKMLWFPNLTAGGEMGEWLNIKHREDDSITEMRSTDPHKHVLKHINETIVRVVYGKVGDEYVFQGEYEVDVNRCAPTSMRYRRIESISP